MPYLYVSSTILVCLIVDPHGTLGELSKIGKDQEVDVVAALVRRFFKDMRSPLLTYELYDTFIGAQGALNAISDQSNIYFYIFCICRIPRTREAGEYRSSRRLAPRA